MGTGSPSGHATKQAARCPGHMGSEAAAVHSLIVTAVTLIACAVLFIGLCRGRTPPIVRSKLSHSAIRSPPATGSTGAGRVSGEARKGAQGQRRRGRDRECRRLRRHRLGRIVAARLVGRGRHRSRDPRTRRQRHAARRRSQGDARGARDDHRAAESAQHRGAAVRHARRAQYGRGLSRATSMQSFPISRPNTDSSIIRSSSKALPRRRNSRCRTAFIRMPQACHKSFQASCRKLKS